MYVYISTTQACVDTSVRFFVALYSCCVCKVTVVVRDVKLIRGMGWMMSKAVQTSVRDGGKKQAANTLNAMVLEAKPEPELDGSGSQA